MGGYRGKGGVSIVSKVHKRGVERRRRGTDVWRTLW